MIIQPILLMIQHSVAELIRSTVFERKVLDLTESVIECSTGLIYINMDVSEEQIYRLGNKLKVSNLIYEIYFRSDHCALILFDFLQGEYYYYDPEFPGNLLERLR